MTIRSYDEVAVQRAINTSRQPISRTDARLIHILLKGRGK
jgi:hypothetical protein